MSIWEKIYRKACSQGDGQPAGDDEAQQAVDRAEKAITATHRQGQEIEEITQKNRTLREHNSFAEMITILFGGAR